MYNSTSLGNDKNFTTLSRTLYKPRIMKSSPRVGSHRFHVIRESKSPALSRAALKTPVGGPVLARDIDHGR